MDQFPGSGDAAWRRADHPAAATSSYTTAALIVLVLYLICWLPGFVANLVYLGRARRDRAAGMYPDGIGYLWALLWVFLLIPILVVALMVIAHVTLQPSNGSNTLNTITNAL